jgi:CheY-like chemotaxis protein
MKRKILVADKDSSLKEAFRVIFSDDQYEILYASNGKEAQKLAEESRPEIFIINVNLSKYSGIEVYKKLQKDKYLDNARFFFLKDENDKTELLGFQAEGVIEKPINFFRVHERIHKEEKEEDVIDLTDVIEEPARDVTEVAEPAEDTAKPNEGQQATASEPESATAAEQAWSELAIPEGPQPTDLPVPEPIVPAPPEPVHQPPEPVVIAEQSHMEEPRMETPIVEIKETIPERMALVEAPDLEIEVRAALGPVMQDTATKLVEAMTPAVSKYIEDYTRRVLFEIAERVIREEIDKLLKESTEFPGKQI